MAVELNSTTAAKYNETDASNTAASPNGWPSGTYPNQVEANNRTTLGAVQRFWNRANGQLTVGGSANAITLTPSNTAYPTSYVIGELYQFTAGAANTGATTININSLGAKNLFKKSTSGAVALVGGEIQSGDQVIISYDGTHLQIVSALPIPAATGTINSGTAGQIAYYAANGSTLSGSSTIPTINVVTITTSSTYTPSAKLIYAILECVGGGGGGGGVNSTSTTSGGGGGAGAYSKISASASAIGASQTVTIGSAGTVGSNSGGTGGTGGTTSVGTLCTAVGGVGGVGSSANNVPGAGGIGGASGTGIVSPGGNGNGGSVANTCPMPGQGGASIYGSGAGQTGSTGISVAGTNGVAYGSGGSGAGGNGSANTGGLGAQGVVVITEFCWG